MIITDGEEYLVQTAAINYIIMKQEKAQAQAQAQAQAHAHVHELAQLPKVICKKLVWGEHIDDINEDINLAYGAVDVVFAADALYW